MRLYCGIILILLLASAAYLYCLHLPSCWLEEAVTMQFSRDWNAMWGNLLNDEATMCLYYLQMLFWQQGSQPEFYTPSKAPQSAIREAYAYLGANAGAEDIIVLEFRLQNDAPSSCE